MYGSKVQVANLKPGALVPSHPHGKADVRRVTQVVATGRRETVYNLRTDASHRFLVELSDAADEDKE